MLLRALGLIALVASLSLSTAMATEKQSKSKFEVLSDDWASNMDRQRAFVADLIADHFTGLRLTRTQADFAILQKIVDAKIIPKEETWKLQALGIVFGDALAAKIDGLAWCEVTDEFGNNPTLRYRQTTLQLNAMTMISKRVEQDKEIDIEAMADWLAETVQKKGATVDRD